MALGPIEIPSPFAYGNPEDSINPRKLIHMEESAHYYVQDNDFKGTWQIDVISIIKKDSTEFEIIHFENVVT